MRSGAYPYPADEFDAAARAGGPRGVHRAPRSRWSRWWPFLVVLVVFPALAYGIVTWLSDWDGLSSLGSDTAAEQPKDGTTGDPEPTATGTATAPAETTAPTETPTTPPPPPADLSRSVMVYNSTNTSGLARNGADRLTAAGFTSTDVADWKSEDPAASVVYYASPEDVTTAQLVATTLGLPATSIAVNAEVASDGLAVVLASDYKRT